MNPTLTASIGYQTKHYLENASQRQSFFETHVLGRIQLVGTALVGTAEIIGRLACFLLGQIAGLFVLYRSDDINQFLKEQTQGGFFAAIVTSGSVFALLSPDLFKNITFPQENRRAENSPPHQDELNPQENFSARRDREINPLRRQVHILNRSEDGIVNLISDIVSLPFQMLAFCFKLPFYCIYLTFQLAIVLPIRLTLLPIQLMLLPFQIFADVFSVPRDPFELDFI